MNQKMNTKLIAVMVSYLVLVVGLAAGGWFMATNKQNKMMLAGSGALLGLILSVVLWFTVGKKYVK